MLTVYGGHVLPTKHVYTSNLFLLVGGMTIELFLSLLHSGFAEP